MRAHYNWQYSQTPLSTLSVLINPLNPKTKIRILICYPIHFLQKLRGEVDKISSKFILTRVQSCPYFSWPLCFTKHWYNKEKFDADHSTNFVLFTRQRVKFPRDVYWENKTYQLKKSIWYPSFSLVRQSIKFYRVCRTFVELNCDTRCPFWIRCRASVDRSKVELIWLGSAHEKYGVWTRPQSSALFIYLFFWQFKKL